MAIIKQRIKKHFVCILIFIFLFSFLPLNPTEVQATGSTVYVDGIGGSDSINDGLSPENPFKTFDKAYKEVFDGGTIVVCGNTYVSGQATANDYIALPKDVTITSDPDPINQSVLYFRNLILNGATKFEHIVLQSGISGYGIYANGFPLTLGEGLTIDPTAKSVHDTIYVIGGEVLNNNSANMVEPTGRGSDITVLSGEYNQWAFVAGPAANIYTYGGDYGYSDIITDDIVIESDLQIYIAGDTGTITEIYGGTMGYDSRLKHITYGNSYVTIDADSVEIGSLVAGSLAQSLWNEGGKVEQAEDAKTVITLERGSINQFSSGSENLQYQPYHYEFYTNCVELVVKGGTVGNILAGGVTFGYENAVWTSKDTVKQFILKASVPVTTDGVNPTDLTVSGLTLDVGMGAVGEDQEVITNDIEVILSEDGEIGDISFAEDIPGNDAKNAETRKITFDGMGTLNEPMEVPSGFNVLGLVDGSVAQFDGNRTLNAITGAGDSNTIVYQADASDLLPVLTLYGAVSAEKPITLRFIDQTENPFNLVVDTVVLSFVDEAYAIASQFEVDAMHGDFTITKSGNDLILTESTSGNGNKPSGGGGSSSSYTVTFNSNGGSTVGSQKIAHNGTVKEPETPTRDGYTFTGWYTDSSLSTRWNFGDKVTRSFTLYAGWKSSDGSGETISYEHTAYISGYPSGVFYPDGTLTRAEASTLFYHLIDSDLEARSNSSFNDVVSSAWYYDAVTELASRNMIAGLPDGSFRPEARITRAEFITMCLRFADVSESGTAQFPDIAANHWASGAINAAVSAGYVDGYPDGTFQPGRSVTRAEAVTILNRIIGCDGISSGNRFSDVSSTHWAYQDITAAATGHDH